MSDNSSAAQLKNQNAPLAKLRLYKALAFIFAVTTAILTSHITIGWYQTNASELGFSQLEKTAPRYDEVHKIIKDLRYSGLVGLLRPEVSLQINFQQKVWHLMHIHRFDEGGRIILDEGRYGVCGALAGYTYQKIQPLFDHRYSIRIVNAAEAGFFPADMGTHMVLKIVDMSAPRNPKVYILDPSFRVYDRLDKLFNYRFYGEMTYMDFVRKQLEDELHPANHAVPIRIRKNTLVSLMVGEAGGRFDPQNFTIALTATKRNEYVSRIILGIRKIDGKMDTTEDKDLASDFFEDDQYQLLRDKVTEFFRSI